MNTLFIITTLVAALTVALLMYQIQRHALTRFYQSALFFPYFISYVIVAVFVFAFLSTDEGLVNRLLVNWGGQEDRVVCLAAVLAGDPDRGESVERRGLLEHRLLRRHPGHQPRVLRSRPVDGTNPWQQARHIALPLLVPLILINVLLSIGRIFYADFGLFYQVTRNSGQLFSTTNVIDTYVFRSLVTTGDIGMASAAGFYRRSSGSCWCWRPT